MVQIDRARMTTYIPIWLLAVTALFLFIRIGVKLWDSHLTEEDRAVIDWRKPEYLKKIDLHSNKIILLDFTAAWCGPCHTMDRTTFLNKDVVAKLKDEFIAVKVVDRSVEDGKNSALVEELQQKHRVYGFPKLVVTIPGGEEVHYSSGYTDPKEFLKFLEKSQRYSGVIRAEQSMYHMQYDEALRHCGDMKNLENWSSSSRSYKATMLAYWHILMMLGRHDEASEVIERGRQHMITSFKMKDPKEWPFPLLDYMQGRLSEAEVAKICQHEDYYRTDLKTVLGLQALQAKERERAIKEFMSAIRIGKTYAETFNMASSYLKVLDPDDGEAASRGAR